MTVDELFKQGHTKMRLSHWGLPTDHIEVYDAGEGHLGPWVKFYSDINEIAGNDNPVQLPIWEVDKETGWQPYVEALSSEPTSESDQVDAKDTPNSRSTKDGE